MYEVQELTPTETRVISKRIFDGTDFFDIKKNSSASMVKINPDFIAVSVLPDWYYIHKKYMKDAIETEEKFDNKSYRFVNGRDMRYYVDKDTMQLAIVEFDTTDKGKNKKVVNKIVFGPGTFNSGKYKIASKVSIFKENKLVKQYSVSLLKSVNVVKDLAFDPDIQTRDLNNQTRKRNVQSGATKTDNKAQEE